jgi:mercuric ion transport protein
MNSNRASRQAVAQPQIRRAKTGFYAALAGTVAVAVCCFTPVLVLALAATGLSAFTPYLDYVLFPALVVLVVLTMVSYRRWKRTARR